MQATAWIEWCSRSSPEPKLRIKWKETFTIGSLSFLAPFLGYGLRLLGGRLVALGI